MTEVQPRRIGRPPLTDRASLIAAARKLGFVGLTVRTVTTEVGVKYSTFYRHYPSFEHLQTAMVDALLSEAEFPKPAGWPWREYLVRTSAQMVDLLNANPGLAVVIMSLPERPHRLVELFRTSTEVMLDAGFSAPDAVLGAAAALDLPVATWAYSPGAASGCPSRAEQARTAPQHLRDSVRAALVDMVDDPPTAWVAARLNVLLDGLQARATGDRR